MPVVGLPPPPLAPLKFSGLIERVLASDFLNRFSPADRVSVSSFAFFIGSSTAATSYQKINVKKCKQFHAAKLSYKNAVHQDKKIYLPGSAKAI